MKNLEIQLNGNGKDIQGEIYSGLKILEPKNETGTNFTLKAIGNVNKNTNLEETIKDKEIRKFLKGLSTSHSIYDRKVILLENQK